VHENKRSPGTTRGPANLGHEVRAIISRSVEEPWVIAERERIAEAREFKDALMAVLGLKGYRHNNHPEIWSRERVARLERRRRRAAA
jgi:hypothetical protein